MLVLRISRRSLPLAPRNAINLLTLAAQGVLPRVVRHRPRRHPPLRHRRLRGQRPGRLQLERHPARAPGREAEAIFTKHTHFKTDFYQKNCINAFIKTREPLKAFEPSFPCPPALLS